MNLKPLLPIGRRPVSTEGGEFNPFWTLEREIGRVFDAFARASPLFGLGNGYDVVPRMDAGETDKDIELTVELPGLEAKDVEINFADGVLTIRGEKKTEKDAKEKDYRVVERRYGSFLRTLELPAGINPDLIKATIANGVLKVTVPKPAAADLKKIPVKAAA